jgi:pyruvate dehydrogenase E2 component (dihydrolipoyllysine-residue acetyltransferase)
MPFTVTMPKLSPTMEEGTIDKWFCQEGDKLEPGDVLIEVTTDKATVEHTVIDGGYLRKIVVKEGESAKVNQVIAIFTESKDEDIESFEISKKVEEKPQDIKLTKSKQDTAESISEELENVLTVKQPVFKPFLPLDDYKYKFPKDATQQRILASPLARRIAEDSSLDLSSVKGSGPNGRVMKRDLVLAQPLNKFIRKKQLPTESPGSFSDVPLTPMRKAIGNRLQQSKSFIPHFYISQEINVDALVDMRNQLKTLDIKVTFNDFIIKATSLALEDHPIVNSCFNSETQSVAYFKTIDISVAVTVEGGLITPIIRQANYKNINEISIEVKELAQKAKEMKLKPEEYQGGSFTISNLGMFKITDFVAVINPPQSAILAIGGIQEKPIVKDNKIIIGKTMILTLSADHRVVDGVDGAKFMKDLQKYLENPIALLL